MIPLHDDNPTQITPLLTCFFIAACVLVFLWQSSLGPQAGRAAVYSLGVVPAVLLGKVSLPEELLLIPAELSIVTAMFMHGGFMHLAGNMLYLWIFGNNVEDAMGHFRFLLFYLLSGIGAVIGQVVQNPDSQIPMIGASGAISGVLG
ncbi:MAG TPA: rhomboid family intramembrane serine protease, partial [Gammaproteobacteria bacterium]|nr:rhomboid family intramembrane serine protease [Gammaproteobacteria bacterium]